MTEKMSSEAADKFFDDELAKIDATILNFNAIDASELSEWDAMTLEHEKTVRKHLVALRDL